MAPGHVAGPRVGEREGARPTHTPKRAHGPSDHILVNRSTGGDARHAWRSGPGPGRREVARQAKAAGRLDCWAGSCAQLSHSEGTPSLSLRAAGRFRASASHLDGAAARRLSPSPPPRPVGASPLDKGPHTGPGSCGADGETRRGGDSEGRRTEWPASAPASNGPSVRRRRRQTRDACSRRRAAATRRPRTAGLPFRDCRGRVRVTARGGWGA